MEEGRIRLMECMAAREGGLGISRWHGMGAPESKKKAMELGFGDGQQFGPWGLTRSDSHCVESGPKGRSRWWGSPGYRRRRRRSEEPTVVEKPVLGGLPRAIDGRGGGHGGGHAWRSTGYGEGARKRGHSVGRRSQLSGEGHQEEGGHLAMGFASRRDDPTDDHQIWSGQRPSMGACGGGQWVAVKGKGGPRAWEEGGRLGYLGGGVLMKALGILR